MLGKKLGAYRIESELGVGGMGRVFLAVGEGGSRFAVKVLHPHLLENPDFLKRFLREAGVGKAVRHPNVVRTLDVDAAVVDGSECRFLVMEYVEGQTLRELLSELGVVPEELCRHIGREVAKGLAAIHAAGAVHRDMKPENVLITPDHDVKIMDMGVALLTEETLRLSQTGIFVGSVHYAAPEQFQSDGVDVDARADLHALGVILYELASDENPYFADNVRRVMRRVLDEQPRRLGELNPQVSTFFEEVVHKLLEKDRESRFGSAGELLGVLEKGEQSTWWRGRSEEIRKETKEPLRRIRIPRETAVYGREDELGRLCELYEAAKAGDGRVVLIDGEAGIGKTRLVDELVATLHSDGEDLNFLFGSYPPGGAATAAGAWSTAYREQFGEEGSAPWLPTTPALVPAFDALLRGEPPPKGEEPLSKETVHTVFAHATRALAKERTTVVLIEDLHFAPEEGRALFAALSQVVPGERTLLIGTIRPGHHEDWVRSLDRLEAATHLVLSRLGPKDLARLLEEAFGSERMAARLGHRISIKSDGNPFFVFEIIAGLRDNGLIVREPDGAWATTRAIEEIEIPSSVLELIQARLSQLDEAEQEVLDVASCCGFEFDHRTLVDVLDTAPVPLLRRLGRIEKAHRLIHSVGTVFVFDHHQVQEAVYAGLSEPLRREYHAAIGESLQSRGSDDQVAICEQFLAADRSETALPHLDEALDQLGEGHQNEHAAALAGRVLAISELLEGPRRIQLLLDRADRLDRLGARREQREAVDEAIRLSVETGDIGLQADARRRRGLLLWQTSDLEGALAELGRARDLARKSGDLRRETRTTGSLGVVHTALGQSDEAEVLHLRQQTLAREIGDRASEAAATGNLGGLHQSQGRYGEAEEHFLRHRELAREVGYGMGRVIATSNLGTIRYLLGRLDEAWDHYEHVLALSREIGFRFAEGYILRAMAEWGEARGDAETAERLHRGALALRREIGQRDGVAESLAALGAFLAGWGRAAEAVPLLERAHALALELGSPDTEVLAASDLALLPGGDPDQAASALESNEANLEFRTRLTAHFRLWQATKGPSHLKAAHDLLVHLVDHAPEDCRQSMIDNVPLHRGIADAWAEHGGRRT